MAELRGQAGVLLIECLVYIAVLAVILAVAWAVFFRADKNSRGITGTASDIARVLQAGEQWREDVRSATAAPAWREQDGERQLAVPHGVGEVRYVRRGDAIFRNADGTHWQRVLVRVKESEMQPEERRHVTAWRWEVELLAKKNPRERPQFTFQAALTNQHAAALKR